MQDLRAIDVHAMSLSYMMGANATLRRLRDDMVKAQGASIAPPVDDSIVSGSYADVLGLQKNQSKVHLEQRQHA